MSAVARALVAHQKVPNASFDVEGTFFALLNQVEG
jgi:hypothetical protein